MTMINLSKDQKIDLTKDDGSDLTVMSLGLNWGMIEKKGFFGSSKEAVDLDASAVVVDANGSVLETIYYGNLKGSGGWIQHTGDDLTGDEDGDDGMDNETITVDLTKAPTSAAQVVFCLNSFGGHNFKDIPHASIRIYEGQERAIINEQDNVHAKYQVNGHDGVSMVMGRLYKRNDKWKFVTIGETTSDRRLNETVQTICRQYLG